MQVSGLAIIGPMLAGSTAFVASSSSSAAPTIAEGNSDDSASRRQGRRSDPREAGRVAVVTQEEDLGKRTKKPYGRRPVRKRSVAPRRPPRRPLRTATPRIAGFSVVIVGGQEKQVFWDAVHPVGARLRLLPVPLFGLLLFRNSGQGRLSWWPPPIVRVQVGVTPTPY